MIWNTKKKKKQKKKNTRTQTKEMFLAAKSIANYLTKAQLMLQI